MAWVLSVAMLYGCSSFSVRPQIPLDGETAQTVLQALRQRESNITAIKGLFQASITGAILPISQNLNGVLFYHRPDDVRLRGFTRVGGVIFEFLRENDSYQLRLPSAGKFVKGRISELNQNEQEFSQIVELSLRAVNAILGAIEGIDTGQIALYDDDGRIRLDVQPIDDKSKELEKPFDTRVWLNKYTFDVVQVEYFTEDGDVAMKVDCSDFRIAETDGPLSRAPIRLPFRIRAEDFRSSGGSMNLIFQELVANAKPPKS